MKQIKFKLKEHFESSDENILSFEQNAGLKRNTIYNILSDKSQNPTIETIVKIADRLNCTIDEFLGREECLKNYAKNYKSTIEYNEDLFNDSLSVINNYIKDNKLHDIKLGDIIYLLQEIYQYSKNSHGNTIDEKFATWILKNHFNSN